MKTNAAQPLASAPSLTGMDAVIQLKAALAAAGLPRTSTFNGGELMGWTPNYGSTGFSIRLEGERIVWHLVISGRPHLNYTQEMMGRGEHAFEGYYPTNPEKLAPRIAQVFASLGMKALTVQANCWSTAWDDDVGYEVETERPLWLNDRNDVSARDAKKGDKPHEGNEYVTIRP